MIARLFDPGTRTGEELREFGRSARGRVPRRSHGRWRPTDGRRDPLDLLRAQDEIRVQELLPIRYGRLLVSPFRFFRGTAVVMAGDLATTPTMDVNVQACGDAHIGNFGVYASPERRTVFDVNDFDETLPAPWEWDLKRLVTSLVLDARSEGWPGSVGHEAARLAASRYRQVMRKLDDMTVLGISYEQMGTERFLDLYGDSRSRGDLKELLRKVRRRTHRQAVDKWVHTVEGRPEFVEDAPILTRLDDETTATFHRLFDDYRTTLRDDRRHVMQQYRFCDAAQRIVGVGSVGLRAYILLLQGRTPDDLVVLQAKQATTSVLSEHRGPSGFERQGQRVVVGQRLMQAATDPFLGWAPHEAGDFYVRQMRDQKGPADLGGGRHALLVEAQVAGGTLARAHARSVDPALIAGYLGKNDNAIEAFASFAEAYADQVERDFEYVTRRVAEIGMAVERNV